MRFGLDGTDYEIDLSAKHAGELRKALARYLTAGTAGTWDRTRRPSRSGRGAIGAGGPNTDRGS